MRVLVVALTLAFAVAALADDPATVPATSATPTTETSTTETSTTSTAETPTPAAPTTSTAETPTPATSTTSTTSTTETSADGAVATEIPSGRRVGDPVPLTRREPTLRANSLMIGVRYGLVGTGPTRFINDIRYSLTDTLELRTTLAPWPAGLTARARFGSQQSELGAFLVEGGLAYFDAGIRLVEDTGEPAVGIRLHPELDIGWARAFGERFSVNAYAHYRARFSFLPDDDQHAVAVDAHVTYDLLPSIALSGGLGFASTLGTPVREPVVNFVETDRAGISHLLARDDGGEQSLTIPLTLTYGRVDSFDVDLFCTPRVYPEFGIAFGAGVRLRLEPLFGDG